MGGEGHIFDMIIRSRQNREILRSRHERIRQIREIYQARYNKKTSKPYTPENLKAIKEEIRREIGRRKRRALWITGGILIVLIAGLLYWILAYHPLKTFTETFLR